MLLWWNTTSVKPFYSQALFFFRADAQVVLPTKHISEKQQINKQMCQIFYLTFNRRAYTKAETACTRQCAAKESHWTAKLSYTEVIHRAVMKTRHHDLASHYHTYAHTHASAHKHTHTQPLFSITLLDKLHPKQMIQSVFGLCKYCHCIVIQL